MAKGQRTRRTEARNWSLIVYPDSAPKDWEKILNDLQIPWACSPLHDKDINEDAEGGPKLKKPHYHIVLAFEGKKSFEQIVEITKALNTVHPQVCHSLVGSLRYFTHRDNPEKYQYEPTEIRGFGGIDIDKYMELTATQKKAVCNEILSFIIKYHITEFQDLFFTAFSDGKQDWLDVMSQSNFATPIKMMLSSVRHADHTPFNPLTGEVADVVGMSERDEVEDEDEFSGSEAEAEAPENEDEDETEARE